MQISEEIIQSIIDGAVGVMPTDTIFGIVASVNKPESLKRIYDVKKRDHSKKLIHLVANIDQLKVLGIQLNKNQLKSLETIWPGPISVEFDCDDTAPYLHKGTYCIAVRMPKDDWLRAFVSKAGPIVATSANISEEPVSADINEIKRKLTDLDFYIDGPVGDKPSKLVRLHTDGRVEYLSR